MDAIDIHTFIEPGPMLRKKPSLPIVLFSHFLLFWTALPLAAFSIFYPERTKRIATALQEFLKSLHE